MCQIIYYLMEYARAKSLKNNSRTEKFPDISANTFVIRSSFNHTRQRKELSAYASTPDPSLTVKMMKITYRSEKKHIEANSFELTSKLTNDKLSDLIKNSAVTFISPNELINQIEILSESSPPARKLIEETPTEISVRKLNKFHINKGDQLFSNNFFPGLKISQHYLFKKRSKKLRSNIEVHGQGLTYIDRNSINNKDSQETRSIINDSNCLNLSKELNFRATSRPSILCNRKHKYFRCFPQEAATPPLNSAQTFYIPSKNLR